MDADPPTCYDERMQSHDAVKGSQVVREVCAQARCTPTELAAWQTHAARNDESLSRMIRRAIRALVTREQADSKTPAP